MKRIDWGTLALTLAAISVAVWGSLCMAGCVSRAQWERGLEQTQAFVEAADQELGQIRQDIAGVQELLQDAEPGSGFAAELAAVLDDLQEQASILQGYRARADERILDLQGKLADVPPGASDFETTLYMLSQGGDDAAEIISGPVGAGIGLAAAAVAAWFRRKWKLTTGERDTALADAERSRGVAKTIVHGVEAGKRADKQLAELFDRNAGVIRSALGPDVQRFVSEVRRSADGGA